MKKKWNGNKNKEDQTETTVQQPASESTMTGSELTIDNGMIGELFPPKSPHQEPTRNTTLTSSLLEQP